MQNSPLNPDHLEPKEPPVLPVRALEPKRGEVFDLDMSEESEVEKARIKSPFHPLWLGVVALFLFGAYMLGVKNEQRSTRPIAVGPFPAQKAAKPPIQVHVAGAVNKPGLYQIKANGRVQDAIQKAGGPSKTADLNALNLADWVQDGDKIEVPARLVASPTLQPTPENSTQEKPVSVEVEKPIARPELRESPIETQVEAPVSITRAAPKQADSSAKPAAPKVGKTSDEYLAALKEHPININSASNEELMKLPGVGEKMAERIVAYRSENGPFKSVDELDEVKGIGEKKMEVLREVVVVR